MKIPRHVAIIMDGNGRWAQSRNHPRVYGHIRGSKKVKDIVKEANHLGIKVLTLYAFSTENWMRPESEKNVLWKLFKKYLIQECDELNRENVKLQVIGEVERLDESVQNTIKLITSKLSKNTGLQFNIAVSYGSRAEILKATREIALQCQNGVLDSKSISEKTIEEHLWTAHLDQLSEVDLVIRTSGEKRTSNFLLWQAAYAEYVFYDVNWPDFSREHLKEAVQLYSNRERRFGGIRSDSQSMLNEIQT